MTEQRPDIWKLQAQFDIQGLVNALSADDTNIRKRAAAALRKMNATQAVSALQMALAAETDLDTRSMMASALEQLGGEIDSILIADAVPSVEQTMVNRLIKQLNNEESEPVIEAARQLGDLGNKLAVEPLVLLFNDSRRSIQVRLAVAEALLKLESAPVEVALLANLRHADWHIRRNGAAILGQLKAEWAIQPLARAMSDPHQVVRRTARAALKHIGTPEARKALAAESAENSKKRNPILPRTSPLSADAIKEYEEQQNNRTPSGDTGKLPPQAPSGGLLTRVDEEDDTRPPSTERSRAGTKPLDPNVSNAVEAQTHIPAARKIEPTMPIDLDALEASLRADENDKDA